MKRSILLLSTVLFLGGCTSIIHSVTDKPINPDPTNTSLGTDIDDLKLDTYIGVNIKKAHPDLESAHINVHAYNAVILLTGEVPSQKLKVLAGDTARNFHNVRQVHNELQVRGKTSIVSRTNDSLITAHVKTKLAFNKRVSASRIKVITEDSVVYMMGTIYRDMGATAANIAANTRGVKKVVRVFEYLD